MRLNALFGASWEHVQQNVSPCMHMMLRVCARGGTGTLCVVNASGIV